jgi:hypothetical protein
MEDQRKKGRRGLRPRLPPKLLLTAYFASAA